MNDAYIREVDPTGEQAEASRFTKLRTGNFGSTVRNDRNNWDIVCFAAADDRVFGGL